MYSKTVWKDRNVERPRTFTVTNNQDGSITLTPAEGMIIEAGTPIIASNMNNIEEAIYELYGKLITVSQSPPEELREGQLWFRIMD